MRQFKFIPCRPELLKVVGASGIRKLGPVCVDGPRAINFAESDLEGCKALRKLCERRSVRENLQCIFKDQPRPCHAKHLDGFCRVNSVQVHSLFRLDRSYSTSVNIHCAPCQSHTLFHVCIQEKQHPQVGIVHRSCRDGLLKKFSRSF